MEIPGHIEENASIGFEELVAAAAMIPTVFLR